MNIFQATTKIDGIIKSVNHEYKGRKFRILSNYNGQPYGRSKRSMRGQILTVSFVSFDDEKAYIFPEGYRLSLELREVEFIDGNNEKSPTGNPEQ